MWAWGGFLYIGYGSVTSIVVGGWVSNNVYGEGPTLFWGRSAFLSGRGFPLYSHLL